MAANTSAAAGDQVVAEAAHGGGSRARELRALSGIPDVRAGDSVWWHCDMIHSVAPVRDQRGWGNVRYIPAVPRCPRNEAYSAIVRDALAAGSSPADFPAEHYERDWAGRFGFADLNATGRRGLGLDG